MELDAHIVEGLIGLGYDLHIFDKDGKYLGGVDRDTFEKTEIAKLLADPEPTVKSCEDCGRVDGSHYTKCQFYQERK